ncbi:MAG: ribosome biogenesis GTPase YlqF [Bacilli bacterium]|nr:ribosome biogenesis GTPase YlqF [Bacilli bacterium]
MSKKDNVRGYDDKKTINWYPGHMAKTKREISEKLNLIDVVYEVVDARMPLSSKIVDINDLIKDKPRIMVMTKYDLCDKTETDKIIKYYESTGYKVIPVDLMNNNNAGVKKIIDATNEIMVGVNNKRKEKGLMPRAGRVLIVGIPNAGKSTLINRLVGKKAAGVGNTPGFTKSLSWIRINKDLELLDSPGILWPKMENQEAAHILACLSSIKEEILNIDSIAIFILNKLFELYPEKLEERYGITELDEDYIETYDMIASRRGALSRGGVADYEKVSNIIVRDLKNGYFGDITLDRLK